MGILDLLSIHFKSWCLTGTIWFGLHVLQYYILYIFPLLSVPACPSLLFPIFNSVLSSSRKAGHAADSTSIYPENQSGILWIKVSVNCFLRWTYSLKPRKSHPFYKLPSNWNETSFRCDGVCFKIWVHVADRFRGGEEDHEVWLHKKIYHVL